LDIYKSIFKPQVARALIKLGNRVVDIKPCKENSDRTIFIFQVTEKLINDLAIVLTQ